MPEAALIVSRRTGVLLLAATLAAAMAAMFPWGDWQGHAHPQRIGWIPFVSWPIRRRDMVLNVLLFVPVGAAAALVFRRPVLAAGLVALGWSLAGESLQLYSHGRFPSATDVVCNVAGAVGAAWVLLRRVQGHISVSE